MTFQNNDFTPEDIVYYGKDVSRTPTKTTGELDIILKYDDGTEVLHQTIKNIVVYGFGVSIANALTKKSRSQVSNFGIKYFKVGTGFQVYNNYTYPNNRTFFDLELPLSSVTQYGRNLRTKVLVKDQLESTNFLYNGVELSGSPGNVLAELSDYTVTRLSESTINIVVKIGKNMANTLSLSEIGLFIKNPECTRKEQAILAAYRTFRNIAKTSDFEIIFNWSINIVDLSDQSSWDVTDPDSGGGGETDPLPPSIEYVNGYGSTSYPFPLTLGFASSFAAIVVDNIVPGSIGFFRGIIPFGFTVNSTTAGITFNGGITLGLQGFTLSAIPTDTTNFGNYYSKYFYYFVEEPVVIPPMGSTNFNFNENLATISWTTPTDVPIGTSAIVKAIIPVSSVDLTGTYPHFFIKETSTFCQINDCTRHADGLNTVEIAFSATTTVAEGFVQNFNVWSTSTISITSSIVPIPTWMSSLTIALVDHDNKSFAVNLITSSNATVLSSIESSGHWETVYKFYGRLYNTGTATRDYAMGVHAFVTVRRNDPIVNIDLLLNNGNLLLSNSDLPGVNNTKQNNYGVVGDFWFTQLALITPANTSAIQDFDSWNFSLLTSTTAAITYNIAPPYPAAGGVKHCFPRNKHYTLRFAIAPVSYVEATLDHHNIMKGKARKDYIGFATAGPRTFFNMRAYGIAMDYMPKLVDSDFAIPQEFYANISTTIPGLAGQDYLFKLFIERAELYMRDGYGTQAQYPGFEGMPDIISNKNFWILGLHNLESLEAGVTFKNPLMGSRLLNSELNYLQLQADRIARRTPHAIYGPSGNPIGTYDLSAAGPPWFGQTVFPAVPNSTWDPSGILRMIRFSEGAIYRWNTPGELQNIMFPEFGLANANVADIPTLTNHLISNPYFREISIFQSTNNNGLQINVPYDSYNRFFVGSHNSLGGLHLYNLAISTNDRLAKLLLETFGCNISLSKPQYHCNIAYYGSDLQYAQYHRSIKYSLEGRRIWSNPANQVVLASSGVSATPNSHRGWTMQTHRWDAWDAFLMTATYQIAPQKWRTNYSDWLNIQASCLAYGWIQENGFWDGRDYQNFSPHPNDPLGAFLAGNYWAASPGGECVGINWLGSNRVTGPLSNNNLSYNGYPFLGNGIIPNTVGVAQSLEVNYMMLAALGLYRTIGRSNSFIKTNILSAIALQGSSFFFEPGLQVQTINITAADYAAAGSPQQDFQNLLGPGGWAATHTSVGVMYFWATKTFNIHPEYDTKKGFTASEIACSSLYSGRARAEDCHNGLYMAALASSQDNPSLITSGSKFLVSGTAIGQSSNYYYNTWPGLSDRDKFLNQLAQYRVILTDFGANANFGTYILYHLAYVKRVLGLQ